MTDNIIFISIDNLRFDCVGYQPDKKELINHDVVSHLRTPTLDRIAEKSLCFTQCISTNTYTTSSHASILTGVIPPTHGVRAFYDTRLNSNVLTLTEVLKNRGYRTVLYTDIPDLFVPLDLHRGFDVVMSLDDMRLMSFLEGLADEKIFLFAHFFDVHEPFLHNTNDYRPGSNVDYYQAIEALYREYHLDEFDLQGDCGELWNRLLRGPLARRPIEVLLPLYVKGTTKFDNGRFRHFITSLEAIGMMDNACTVIFSDHGEGRCSSEDREYLSHGGLLYDNVLRVPLMISHPDLSSGTNGALVSTVDIFPTVLDLLGIRHENAIDGVNALSEKRDTAYAETWAASKGSIYATSDGKIVPSMEQWPDFYLKEIAIRTSSCKYVIRNNRNIFPQWNRSNKDGLFSGNYATMKHDTFVERLYKEILCRTPTVDEVQYHAHALDLRILTRSQVVDMFLASDEHQSIIHYIEYDLILDTEENNPKDTAERVESSLFFHDMLTRHAHAVISQKIFEKKPNLSGRCRETMASTQMDKEKNEIFNSLRALGYM